MFEELIIEQCSPTLAGIKTANLFSCSFQDKKTLFSNIRSFNSRLAYKGIRMIPVRINGNRALIYLYRPRKLSQDIENNMCKKILKKCGYCNNAGKCILKLIQKFREETEFPHEIGLFLGYPPNDVEGFIKYKGECCKTVGYWKVYGDEEEAKKLFENYSKCTRIYKEQYAKGITIERLTVAV